MLDADAGTEARFRRLRRLTRVSRALTSATSIDQVLSLAVAEAALLLDGSRAALLLSDDEGRLQVRATHAIPEPRLPRDEPAQSASLGQVFTPVLGHAC